jgi:hypothetical protein
VKQQELKNLESEDDDSMFYLFSIFFEFAVCNSFIQYAENYHRRSWQNLFAKQMTYINNFFQPVFQQVMVM